MIGRDELAARLERALGRAGEPEAELYARTVRRGFARFAIGEIRQHMLVEEPKALARVARGKRVAQVSTSDLSEDGLVVAIRAAADMAPLVPEDPAFPGFATSDEPPAVALAPFARATAECTAERRADMLAPVLGAIAQAGFVGTGALEAAHDVEAVATTHGLVRDHEGTKARFMVWALETSGGVGAAGHGRSCSVDLDALELEAETERAIRDCARGRDPIALGPGEYDVVLEPPCVAEVIEWMALIAFGARELHDGSSPLAGRIGERISGEALSVADDPTGPLAFAAPFDREGTTRSRVELVERGVARGVVYDRTWASRAGKRSTGGSVASTEMDSGPYPSSLVVEGGSAESAAELVAGLERGLYVRRLHYVNGMLEPRRAVMTGLTRDGTFLVEHGKVGRAVGNLRFTDSMLEAFDRVDGVTRARELCPTWWSDAGSVAAPAVRIRGLRFTGGSQKRLGAG